MARKAAHPKKTRPSGGGRWSRDRHTGELTLLEEPTTPAPIGRPKPAEADAAPPKPEEA
jgi:hypothetical protein